MNDSETEKTCLSATWAGYSWSPWLSLDASVKQFREQVTTQPGFYRVRASSLPYLIYVGQTGRDLRERARSLSRGVYRASDDPPWNDPHTAAPTLWAYRHEDQLEYEFSVTVAELDYPTRQCREDSLLYLHRKEYGHSTLCNHGRLHPWWTRSSNRGRGTPTQRRENAEDYASLPPAIGNGDFLSNGWLGLKWTEPCSLDAAAPDSSGVYRIIKDGRLAYIGESKRLGSRIKTHSSNPNFSNCVISLHVMPTAKPHQLKEREADLIGAYYLKTKESSLFQYRPLAS
jgi:hypothetical protein